MFEPHSIGLHPSKEAAACSFDTEWGKMEEYAEPTLRKEADVMADDLFVDALHNETWEDRYLAKRITCKSMIFERFRDKESLNGFWHYGIDQYDTCLRADWYKEITADEEGRPFPLDYDFDGWPLIRVPSCWNTEKPELFYYEGSLVYTRKFRYERKKDGERVFLKFGAVQYDAKVFLNREYLGCHKGGSTPFYLEISDHLQTENRLLVVANNTRKPEQVPTDNTDWFNYGGIYRDVELIRVPQTFIKDFFLSLVPNSGFRKIHAELIVDGPMQNGQAQLEIAELGLNLAIDVEEGRGEIVFDADPELWSPDHPKLYDVRLTFGDDAVRDRVGFREIRVDGMDILLNGEKLFLKGVSAHEESVPNGKAVTEEEIRENFRLAKEMNANYMRLAHYPHTERAAQIADEMGFMLWEEIPVYWAIRFDNPATYQDAENQLSELVIRDRNRASVIIWSVGNENADTDSRLSFMRRLTERTRELDPTRLVSAACFSPGDRLARHLDLVGINEYYGWYNPDFSRLFRFFADNPPEKPVIISEFGADAKAGHRGSVDDKGTEDCQLDIYRKQVDAFRKIPAIRGTSPWILYDFRCPRRLHPVTQNYYNTKGLLNADKTYKKPAFHVMREFYRTIEP